MSKLTRHLILNMLDLKIHEHAWLLDVTLVSFVKQLTDVSKGSLCLHFQGQVVQEFQQDHCREL